MSSVQCSHHNICSVLIPELLSKQDTLKCSEGFHCGAVSFYYTDAVPGWKLHLGLLWSLICFHVWGHYLAVWADIGLPWIKVACQATVDVIVVGGTDVFVHYFLDWCSGW